METKKIILFTIILMITISSLSIVNAALFGSDTKEVKVDGVIFVLDNSIKITSEQNNFTNFHVKSGITGFLSKILNEQDLEGYIKNDTELGYTVFEVNSGSDIKEYGFIDADSSKGYFIIFQKDGKNFVYKISTGLNADDRDVKQIAGLMSKFIKDNSDIKPI